MRKRLFIFDMGGVMCTNTNVVEAICKKLDLEKGDFFHFAKSENFLKIQSGEMKMDEFWQRFSEESGMDVKEDYFEILFQPQRNEDMYQLVNQLRKETRVVAGTNTIDPHYLKHLKNGDYDVFEKVYPSNLIGIAKPNPAFFRTILEKEQCLPSEAVFIDDDTQNVESAADIGLTAIHFTSYEELKQRLTEL